MIAGRRGRTQEATPGRGPHLSSQADMRTWFAAAAGLVLACGLASAQSDPASLPARDAHEGFLVACDPYRDAARAEARLGKKNPLEAGIVPVEVFFRNDSEKAIRVDLESIRLFIEPPDQPHQRLEPLALEDVIERMLNKGGPPDLSSPRRRIPHPSPRVGRGKKWKELEEKLRPLSLEVGMVAPGATVRGFLFFDLDRRYELLPHSRLYVPDVKFLAGNQSLMYFEVDLGPAARR